MPRRRAVVLGVEGVWWSPRSSKSLRPDFVGLGGFDSHTLPPRRAAWSRASLVLLTLLAGLALPLRAQSSGGTRAGATATALVVAADSVGVPSDDLTLAPPITPRRAFLSSLLLPGSGQARLDRPYAGGLFVALEVLAVTMRHRATEDLRIAQRFSGDSMPLRYQSNPITGLVARDTLGRPIVTAWQSSRYTEAWVRTRRLHREDWTALLIFNHLFAGADAFVAAQLWDLPQKVGFRQTPFGSLLSLTLSFGSAPRR